MGEKKAGPPWRTGWPVRGRKFARAFSSLSVVLLGGARRALPAGAGGAEEIRTPDLRRAKAALSQLSYGPSGC